MFVRNPRLRGSESPRAPHAVPRRPSRAAHTAFFCLPVPGNPGRAEEFAGPWPTSPPSVARGNISSAFPLGAELLIRSLLPESALSLPHRSQKARCKRSPRSESRLPPRIQSAALGAASPSAPAHPSYTALGFPLRRAGVASSAASTGGLAGFSFSSPLVNQAS